MLAIVASADVGEPGLSLRTVNAFMLAAALTAASWSPAAAAANDGDDDSTFVPVGTCTN